MQYEDGSGDQPVRKLTDAEWWDLYRTIRSCALDQIDIEDMIQQFLP